MTGKEFIEQHLAHMIEDLGTLVAVPSVLQPETAQEGSPFGQKISRALDLLLTRAAAMGMETVNYDGYAGEITVGQGDTMVGILGHIDVVAAGQGWATPPFQMTQVDGMLYGRGTSDDKGPVISSLYAMKYILENGLLPEHCSMRLIVGTDEEEGLRCIDHYVKHAPRLPNISFVPDGYFPLVNCEKGLIDFDLEFPIQKADDAQAELTALSGGSGRNIVANSACCQLHIASEQRQEVLAKLDAVPELTVVRTEGGCQVTAVGVSTHAMQPEKGKNAISLLLHGLMQSSVRFSHQAFLDAYEQTIGLDFDGQRLDCNFTDELSGALTLNIGLVDMDQERILLKGNTRYPVSKSYQDIRPLLIGPLEDAGFLYRELLSMDPLYISKDTVLIQQLMQAYREVTGDLEHDAFSIGGATYARSIPNAVSFGPLFPYETELAHEANECLSIDSLKKMTEIYIAALEKLLR